MKTPRWLKVHDLEREPFSKDIADDELWLPSSRIDVVDELEFALAEKQHAVVVGEPGVGKTCALRALRARLSADGYRLTYCHNTTLGRRDFYRQICFALDLPTKCTAASVFWALTTHVQELHRERVHPVFLIDEAHLLRDDVLSHLHILTNYSWDQKPILSLVLVGLPDLWRRLSRTIHRSLWSRIHCRIALEPAHPHDTVEYLRHRLELAGCKRSLFASDALALLHEATGGQLRDIDRVARSCLRTAARRKLKRVDRELLADVVDADTSLE